MPDVSAAYELAVYADKALRAGDLPKARQLMAKAADLDGGYAIRAAHMERRMIADCPSAERWFGSS